MATSEFLNRQTLEKLRELTSKVSSKVLRSAVRKGGKTILQKAIQNAFRLNDPSTQRSISDNIVLRTKSRGEKFVARVGVAHTIGKPEFQSTGSLEKTAGADTPYWSHVEFGHKAVDGTFVQPRPFLRPVVEQVSDQVFNEVAQEIEKKLLS